MSGAGFSRVPRLRFRVGEGSYLIPLDAVAEVIRVERPRLIPRVDLDLGGIVNVRGDPVPVVDGGAALQARRIPPYDQAILLDDEGGRLGMLVNAVSRIERRPPVEASEEEEPHPVSFVRPGVVPDGPVGVVEVSGLVSRLKELLGAAALRTGGSSCPSGF